MTPTEEHPAPGPVTLYTGGRIFTGRADAPLAAALAVQGERILAVGTDAAVTAAAGSGATRVDLGGSFVTPGFVDSHTHLLMFGQSLEKVSLRDCDTLEEIQERLRAARAAAPDAERILGISWRFDALGGQDPTAAMIDAVIDDVPVFLEANDLHSVWVNTAALAALGVDALTPDPVGGEIRRDASGAATGFLLETAAMSLVWPYMETVTTDADRDRHLRAACDAYLEAGVTAATEMAFSEQGLAAVERMLQRDGELPITLAAHMLIQPTGDASTERAQIERVRELRERCRTEYGTRSFEIVGVKFVVDGVIDACTAHMHAPYADGSNAEPIWSREALFAAVEAADACGLQLALHAIGDAASALALDAFECALRVNGPRAGRRPRIEHLESATRETVQRMAALGVTASMQPVHCDPAVLENWVAMLGDARAETGFAWQWYREEGVLVALGTDTPTAPHEALHNWYIANTAASVLDPSTTPYHPERCFTPASALEAMTAAGAAAIGRADTIGVLRAGADADFAVLSVDPLREEPGALLGASVTQSVVRGQVAYRE